MKAGVRLFMFLLLSAGLQMQASAQQFNKRFDSWGQNWPEGAWSVAQGADGTFVVFLGSRWVDSLLYSSVVTSLSLDIDGQVLGVDRVVYPLFATYPGWSNSSFPMPGGGFGLGGSTFRVDSLDNWIQRPAFFFFDAAGTVLSFAEVGPENQEWIGRQGKRTPDGGYVICGETSANGLLDAFLIKTDSLLNVEWVRTYGLPNRREVTFSVDMAPWGGYYLGGRREVSTSIYDHWVVRVDEQGIVIGSNDFGSIWSESSGANIGTVSDGSVLVASSFRVSSSTNALRLCLYKVNEAGDLVWSQMYGEPGYNSLFVAQEIVPGGDIIATGFVYHSPVPGYQGVLLRTTNTGDSLWMRYYSYSDSIVENRMGDLRDVKPTPDGGFIAVGAAFSIPGVYSRDVWVVKVDSMGCLEPGCHLITGMDTQITNLGGALRVWPNPMARGAPATLALELPEHFTPQGPLRLTVVSSDGRVVREERLDGASGEFTVPVPASSGLYHLHLSDATRWIAGAKLVVQ